MVLVNRAIRSFSLSKSRLHDHLQNFPPLIGKERGQRVRGRPEVLTQQKDDLGKVRSGESI